jgi:hypothetical protein
MKLYRELFKNQLQGYSKITYGFYVILKIILKYPITKVGP